MRMRCRYHHGASQARQVLETASCGAAEWAGTRGGAEPGERGGEQRQYEANGEAALPAPVRRGDGYRMRRTVRGGLLLILRRRLRRGEAACQGACPEPAEGRALMTPSLRLAACGLRLAACGLRLAACGLRLAACGLRLAACGLRLAACGLRLAAFHCNQGTPRPCQGFSGVRCRGRNRQVRGLASVPSSVPSCPCPLPLGPTCLVRQAATTAGDRAFCRAVASTPAAT